MSTRHESVDERAARFDRGEIDRDQISPSWKIATRDFRTEDRTNWIQVHAAAQ